MSIASQIVVTELVSVLLGCVRDHLKNNRTQEAIDLTERLISLNATAADTYKEILGLRSYAEKSSCSYKRDPPGTTSG